MKSPALMTGALVIGIIGSCRSDHEPFDASKWATGDRRDRGRMYTDLLAQHELRGMTRDQLRDLLTDPEDTVQGRWTYHLDLGFTAQFHMDVLFDGTKNLVDSVNVWD
ncbi:MAG: hypothetical protein ABI432_07535 [Flavobacteriales bacterium]